MFSIFPPGGSQEPQEAFVIPIPQDQINLKELKIVENEIHRLLEELRAMAYRFLKTDSIRPAFLTYIYITCLKKKLGKFLVISENI